MKNMNIRSNAPVTNPPKIAYVLSGGGTKGSFQIGVMKKLAEQGIVPNAIYGTSVGAINAAGYAHIGLEGIERFWRNLDGRKWYLPWTPSHDVLAFNWMNLLLGASDGIYNTKPMRKTLDQACKPSPICEAIVCQNNLNTAAIEYVSNRLVDLSTFLDAVEGSAIIPGIMSPKKGIYVDGGNRMQVPLDKAIADGYDKIYVILCNPLTPNTNDSYVTSQQFPLFKFLNIAYRAIDGLMEHQIYLDNCRNCFKNMSDTALEVYAPEFAPCGTLDFDPKIVPGIIEMGYNCIPFNL